MNGIIVIDKPPRFTSFDVVAVMRGLFGTKKVGPPLKRVLSAVCDIEFPLSKSPKIAASIGIIQGTCR